LRRYDGTVRIDTKNVPTSEIRKKAQASADHIETTTGRKPGKREMKGLQEEAKQALLPTAFTRESHVWVWMDLASNILYTDAISGPKLDDVISLLVRALDGLGAFTVCAR
jgi:recombination associated protein RdgC